MEFYRVLRLSKEESFFQRYRINKLCFDQVFFEVNTSGWVGRALSLQSDAKGLAFGAGLEGGSHPKRYAISPFLYFQISESCIHSPIYLFNFSNTNHFQ